MQAWQARLCFRLLTSAVALLLTAPALAASSGPAWATGGDHSAKPRSYPGDDGLVAFVRQGQVFTIAADGSGERQLTHHGRNQFPRWGPFGLRIAYVHEMRDGSRDIWMMAKDGTHRRRVTHHGDVTAPTWSPDGRWIAFGSPLQKVRARAPFTTMVRLRGSLANRPAQALTVIGSLAWSPDGTTIAYYSDQYPRSPDHYLLTYDVASAEVSLFWEIGGPCCGEGYFADLAWTPDSSAIGYTDGFYEPEAGPQPPPHISMYTFPEQERLDFVVRRGDVHPSFAPSGGRIVLSNQRSGRPMLYVADIHGGDRAVLTRGQHPDWQPLPPTG